MAIKKHIEKTIKINILCEMENMSKIIVITTRKSENKRFILGLRLVNVFRPECTKVKKATIAAPKANGFHALSSGGEAPNIKIINKINVTHGKTYRLKFLELIFIRIPLFTFTYIVTLFRACVY